MLLARDCTNPSPNSTKSATDHVLQKNWTLTLIVPSICFDCSPSSCYWHQLFVMRWMLDRCCQDEIQVPQALQVLLCYQSLLSKHRFQTHDQEAEQWVKATFPTLQCQHLRIWVTKYSLSPWTNSPHCRTRIAANDTKNTHRSYNSSVRELWMGKGGRSWNHQYIFKAMLKGTSKLPRSSCSDLGVHTDSLASKMAIDLRRHCSRWVMFKLFCLLCPKGSWLLGLVLNWK